jgi:hypothetical protein
MNKSNFTQTGGYPLKTERFTGNGAYSIFNSLRSFELNRYFRLCIDRNNHRQRRCCLINGELLEFRQTTVTPFIDHYIVEEAVNQGFKNGVVKQVYAIRYATFLRVILHFMNCSSVTDPLIVLWQA